MRAFDSTPHPKIAEQNRAAILVRSGSALHQRLQRLSRALLAAFALSFEPGLPAQDRPTTASLLTGKPFESALTAPLSLTSENQSVRTALQKLSEARRVSLLLDRRVDPGQVVSVRMLDTPLLNVLTDIARQLKAVDGTPVRAVVIGHTVLLGPEASTTRLRTVLELLPGADSTDRRTLSWDDLEPPTALLDRIEAAFKLRLTDRDQVPADLWAAGTIPSATASQTLLLVLSQFNLSIEWNSTHTIARVVPLPAAPSITRTFALRSGADANALLTAVRTAFPDCQPTLTGRRLSASGRLEELEAIAQLLNPTRPVAHAGTGNGNGKTKRPGKETTYTFEVRKAPLDAFMARLSEQSGFQFEYDADALKAAGLRLDVVLDLKMKDASADELLHAMFDKHRIGFVRNGLIVQLMPLAK